MKLLNNLKLTGVIEKYGRTFALVGLISFSVLTPVVPELGQFLLGFLDGFLGAVIAGLIVLRLDQGADGIRELGTFGLMTDCLLVGH